MSLSVLICMGACMHACMYAGAMIHQNTRPVAGLIPRHTNSGRGPSKLLYPPLKAEDALLVEHMTAAEKDLLLQAEVLMADTACMLDHSCSLRSLGGALTRPCR